MALVVLELSPSARLSHDTRVLAPAQSRAVHGAHELGAQAGAALERACAQAREATTAEMRDRADKLERQLQRQLLLKTMNLQLEYERALRELRARFVETVLSSLEAMLTPLPPAYFARAQASAAAMLGADSAAVLHVAAADERAARAGLTAARDALRIEVDPDLEPGHAFLDTRFGRVQAGLPTQLEVLGEALRAWWAQPAAEPAA